MKSILFIISLFFVIPSWGMIDVNCNNNDCLGSGYTVYDDASGLRARVNCEFGNCRFYGWSYVDNKGKKSRISCQQFQSAPNCFAAGWIERDMETSEIIASVKCYGFDCLRSGWYTQTKTSTSETNCNGSSCNVFGWISRYNNGDIWESRCKWFGGSTNQGDCFRRGWQSIRR